MAQRERKLKPVSASRYFFLLLAVLSSAHASSVQEIHNKITSIGFQDCKVYIHSVDAQSSANGGIIIQVIGEMSNRGDPWRKFVQTFFLAEQPNGYFVLNDIFRFLKEDTVEDDASDAEPVPVPVVPAPEPAFVEEEPTPEPPAELELSPPPREPTPPPVYVPEEEPTTVQSDPPTPPPAAEIAEPNGFHHEEPEPELTPAPVAPSEPQPVPEASPEPAPAPQPEAPPAASPTPPPAPAQHASAPAPPPAKPTPKTWASLAATDPKRWGSQVATESKGLTEVPAASNSPVSTSGNQSPAPHAQPHRSGQHGSREHPAVAAVHSLTTPQCFVKVLIY